MSKSVEEIEALQKTIEGLDKRSLELFLEISAETRGREFEQINLRKVRVIKTKMREIDALIDTNRKRLERLKKEAIGELALKTEETYESEKHHRKKTIVLVFRLLAIVSFISMFTFMYYQNIFLIPPFIVATIVFFMLSVKYHTSS
ncbi:MAG: hypothetical protein AABW88_02640 [Nanoarchaeota archaeon]